MRIPLDLSGPELVAVLSERDPSVRFATQERGARCHSAIDAGRLGDAAGGTARQTGPGRREL